MKTTFLLVLLVAYTRMVSAQDEITLRNGELVKAHVQQVGTDEIKYVKWENKEGPVYSIKKAEVFMIKYENGTKDVYKGPASEGGPAYAASSDETPATLIFFRPKKFAGSAPEIIVGTVEPDEVIVKVHNGSWYKTPYSNFGERLFVTGVYSINPEQFNYRIEPGKTYYIRCTLLSKGLKMMSELEMVDEQTALQEMAKLKTQTGNK